MTGGQVVGAGHDPAGQRSRAGLRARSTRSRWRTGSSTCPGLKIVAPGGAADAYGLLRSAIPTTTRCSTSSTRRCTTSRRRSPRSWRRCPSAGPRGQGRWRCDGGRDAGHAQARRGGARTLLAADGIAVELIDPRTLVPFDYDTVGASVTRTNRLVVVQECSAAGSWGATAVARIAADYFESLDLAPVLISAPDTPVPYAGDLEAAWIPSVEAICSAVREMDRY